MSEERAVTMSNRELGVIQGLAVQHEAIQVSIREQRLDVSDAFSAFRDHRAARAYVVTLYGRTSDPEYAGPSPEPLQLLLISGPAIDGPVDVVLLSQRKGEDEAVPA